MWQFCSELYFFFSPSLLAFPLQLQDLRYMVENFWGSQSAISAWGDLHDLVMVRWNKYQEWSPWNTLLIKKSEAEAHLRLKDLEKVYLMLKFKICSVILTKFCTHCTSAD